MAVITVKEKSTCWISVSFYDRDGVLAVPTSVTVSVRDQATGTVLSAAASVTPASTIELTMTPTINTLQYQGNVYETRVVTVQSNYGAADEANDEYEYQVKNLKGVS